MDENENTMESIGRRLVEVNKLALRHHNKPTSLEVAKKIFDELNDLISKHQEEASRREVITFPVKRS
jgi:hypothetical protein